MYFLYFVLCNTTFYALLRLCSHNLNKLLNFEISHSKWNLRLCIYIIWVFVCALNVLMMHAISKGTSSVMVARGALWNASIFCPKGKLPWEDVKREYVRKASFSL